MDSHLARLYSDQPANLIMVVDYCTAFRFRGLVPAPGVHRWLDLGFQLLADPEQVHQQPAAVAAFREHAGFVLLKEGRASEACDVLQEACELPGLEQFASRLRARVFATLGEIHLVLGNRREARDSLHRAEQLQHDGGFWGDQADFTFTSRAKSERRRQSALDWIERARQLQSRLHNRMGLVRSLLLESRLGRDDQVAAENREIVLGLREQLPALTQCPLLARVLGNWDSWVTGQTPETEIDDFWGV
jgi:ATP/maltotriose-dependent transcriptional regulator MalT